MQLLKVSFVFFFSLMISSSMMAQVSDADALVMSDSDRMVQADQANSFSNNDANIVFIDIEALGGNVNDLAVLNQEGDIVYKENMMGLPSNTIYELDMAEYKKGNYTVRVRTYSDVLKHEVTVK